ncbi:MAG: hypothetical protein AB8B97_04485 [Granulosicoccus sp.]
MIALVISSRCWSSLDDLARQISQGPTPDTNMTDEHGLTWRSVENSGTGFALGENIPADSSVLIALPMERTVDWDPYARVHTIPKWRSPSVLYVKGEPVWDNYERRPLDFANPPMVEQKTLSVLRIDGSGSLSLDIELETSAGSLVLPLESAAPFNTLEPRGSLEWLDDWNKQFLCEKEVG